MTLGVDACLCVLYTLCPTQLFFRIHFFPGLERSWDLTATAGKWRDQLRISSHASPNAPAAIYGNNLPSEGLQLLAAD